MPPRKKRRKVKRNSSRPKQKGKLMGFKAPKRGKSAVSNKIHRRILTKNIAKYLGGALVGILIILCLYILVDYAVSLRLTDSVDEGSVVFVIGFDKVPEYPDSTFIFQNYLEEETVQKFISEGLMVYRTAPGTKLSDVEDFYIEEMAKYNWELVSKVAYESEEQKPGIYWTKNGKAVRIYSALNDIWYQLLSAEDAQTGLSAEVDKEKEREKLLMTSEGTDLLPDYPWRVTIPPEYLVSYTSSALEDLRTLQVLDLNRKLLTEAVPIGWYSGGSYDSQLDSYMSDLNDREGTSWGVINSVLYSMNGYEAVRATLVNQMNEEKEVVVVGNSSNSAVYAFFNWDGDQEIYDYILNNIISVEPL